MLKENSLRISWIMTETKAVVKGEGNEGTTISWTPNEMQMMQNKIMAEKQQQYKSTSLGQ